MQRSEYVDRETFLALLYKATKEVFNKREQKYVFQKTRLMKLFIITAEVLREKGHTNIPVAYGWYNHGLFSYQLYNEMVDIDIFRLYMEICNKSLLDYDTLYLKIKGVMRKLKPYFIKCRAEFDNFIHNQLPSNEDIKKYYRAVCKMNKGFLLSECMGMNEQEHLQRAIEELEQSVNFEYRANERNEVLWKYTDTLFIMLDKYDGSNEFKKALLQMKGLFNNTLLSIISPYPESLSGNPAEVKKELEIYNSNLDKKIKEFYESLEIIKDNYPKYFLTYEELLNDIENMKFDEKTDRLISKIIYEEGR